MTRTDDELAAARSRIAELENEIAALRAPRITVPPLPTDFRLPSESEARRLVDLIWRAAPVLAPLETQREAARKGCWAAFLATAAMPRSEKINARYDRVVWLNRCLTMLKNTSFANIDVSLFDFTTATLMHGTDLAHSFDAARWPHDLGWNFGDYSGRPASDKGWRDVLSSGRLSAPVALPASSLPPLPSPVRIEGGDRRVGERAEIPGW
jgi:hypothetical protein